MTCPFLDNALQRAPVQAQMGSCQDRSSQHICYVGGGGKGEVLLLGSAA